MRRREFIAALGGAAAMPLAARAQPASPVIGFLNTGSPELLPHHLSVFRQALGETGFVEGRNAVVEYRWARGHYDRLPALAAELVRGNVLFWEKYMTEMDESPAAGRRRVPWRGTNPDTQQRGDGELGRAPGPAIVGRNDDSGMTCSSRLVLLPEASEWYGTKVCSFDYEAQKDHQRLSSPVRKMRK